ncbi:hypothetical protein HCG51_31885 [Tolypothrix sp. PCC 7910]|uniref:hypothetical protein n=1 Tax=Tolypothrix sp. PCC 7910 TaxID=2099387 RepID=UPI00142772C5|nr:hypothetical protein [Tolypothrix sp. PCC 7910]QIR40835.1 hypothetical protein HCG51_31885 [Tolypothrix sp. PCC 7910]
MAVRGYEQTFRQITAGIPLPIDALQVKAVEVTKVRFISSILQYAIAYVKHHQA